jgi:hypothetical protein
MVRDLYLHDALKKTIGKLDINIISNKNYLLILNFLTGTEQGKKTVWTLIHV